jgi:hypothetical protein
MLGTSLASNGMLKPDLSTQAGDSVFVATYGAGISDSELADTKERDLEAGGGQRVVPIEVCLLFLLPSLLILSLINEMDLQSLILPRRSNPLVSKLWSVYDPLSHINEYEFLVYNCLSLVATLWP